MKKWTKQKVRTRLVRKGLFVTLPKPFTDLVNHQTQVSLYQTVDLYRTVLDYALFDLCGPDLADREEIFEWLNPRNSTDFDLCCELAMLNASKTRGMMLIFLDKFFPETVNEMTCYYKS